MRDQGCKNFDPSAGFRYRMRPINGGQIGNVRLIGSISEPLRLETTKEDAKMPEYRIRVAPNTVAYADGEKDKLIVEFAIPGAPTDTIDVKILEDSVHLTAPARDIEYVSALALGWPVKPDKAEATYEHGLLRIEVPFKDPMEDAVKVTIKAGGAETKTKVIEAK
jgi:HSP20 family molecular chaperone IbpA